MAPRLPLRPAVYLLAFLLCIVLFNLIPQRPASSTSKSLSGAASRIWGVSSSSAPSFIPSKPNAALLILCRNEDLGELLPTLSNLESTFNSHPLTSYRYVLLNDQEFTPYFKSKLTAYLTSARQRFGGPHASDPDIRFGQVPPEHWRAPDWIDWEKAKRRWEIIAKSKVPYAMSESYRHMCRFQSGFFYRHPLVKDLDFYWRVEPQTRYTCNLVPSQGAAPTSWDDKTDGTGDFFDPFRWMKKHNKKYGWVLSLKEYQATIKTLWPKARMWLMKNPQYHSPNLDILPFISKEDKIGYNLCHFWNNFEIASLDFFRSEAYQAFFDHLEELGIFYYDRTGDAPVHTIAVSWFLSKEEVHQFTNIGYYHTPFHYCPQHPASQPRCACDPHQTFVYDLAGYGCQKEWDLVTGTNSTEEILSYNKAKGWPDLSTFRVLDIPHGQ